MPQPAPAERIAIVGIGGIFPGAPDLDTFWKNIAGGVDSGRHVPEGRWYLSPEKAYAPWPPQPDRVYSTWGCFIEGFQFDPAGLNIESDLLSRLDPMFHLGLHAARAAFHDAKQLGGIDHSRVGVILGNIALPTESTSAICRDVLGRTFVEKLIDAAENAKDDSVRRGSPDPAETPDRRSPLPRVATVEEGDLRSQPRRGQETRAELKAGLKRSHWHPLNRYAAGLPSSLIAQGLGLGGIAFTLDAACASSLYALKFASEELLAHRADAMLAGGMSRPDCQYTQMGFAQLQALSKSGRCAPLSGEADGLVVGEGAGVFVLKRLSDAVAAGDHIYGVIAGIGLSNDRGANLLAPHSEGQLRAMRSAYEQAGWQPSDVDLIECHATGTPVGDAVEIASLHELWQHESAKPHQCVIGGVKSNVGHLLTGAGAAGLMKVLFALKHRTLPPTANYSRPAERLTASNSPFRVLGQAEPWLQRSDNSPRRATINAFGFGGINAHVLIEEWDSSLVPSPPSSGERARGRGLSGENVRNSSPQLDEGRTPHPLPFKARGEGTGEEAVPIAIVGLDSHVGTWASKQSVQENDFQGKPLEWTELNWWGVEQSDWFRREGHSDDTGFVPTRPAKPTGHGITEVRMPMGEFRIPPLEVQDMLPQQQLMLKVASGAIRDAERGRARNEDSVEQAAADRLRLRTGVFIGIELDPNTTNFHLRWSVEQDAPHWAEMLGLDFTPDELAEWIKQLKDAVGPPLTPNRVMGNLGGIVASRLAREFDVGGPSFTISAEENSGLRALELATHSLQRGELDQAVVGAVDLPCDVRGAVELRRTAGSSGGDMSDGSLSLVLKRLDDALHHGDKIHAVIRSMDNRGGCHIAPPLSFVIPCGAATGLAYFVMVALSLRDQVQLEPSPHFCLHNRHLGPRRVVVPGFDVDGRILLIEMQETPTGAVAARGNAVSPVLHAGIFVVDGDSPDELVIRLKQLALRIDSSISVERLAKLWFRERPSRAERRLAVAFVVKHADELSEAVHAALGRLRGDSFESLDRRVSFSREPLGHCGRFAFVFPGSGNAFPGMGREILTTFPDVLRQQEANNNRLRDQYRPDLIWYGESIAKLLKHHKTMIFSQVAMGTAICDLLALFGVKPTASIGYSLGESAALFGLRAWTDRDEMLYRMEESTLFGSDLVAPFDAARKAWGVPEGKAVEWVSGVIDRSADEVRTAIASLVPSPPSSGERARLRGLSGEDALDRPTHRLEERTPHPNPLPSKARGEGTGDTPRVYLLIINTPRQCVIGGDRSQVEQLVRNLNATFVPLVAPSTVHCDVLSQVEAAYHELHLMRTTPPQGIDFYSAVWGHKYELTRESAADAIVAQAVDTIDFPRVIEQAYADGVRVFVEIGPGSSCTKMIDEILGDRPHLARAALPNTSRPVETFLELLAALIAERVPVDLSYLYGQGAGEEGQKTDKSRGREVITRVGGLPFEIPSPPGGWKFIQNVPLRVANFSTSQFVADAGSVHQQPSVDSHADAGSVGHDDANLEVRTFDSTIECNSVVEHDSTMEHQVSSGQVPNDEFSAQVVTVLSTQYSVPAPTDIAHDVRRVSLPSSLLDSSPSTINPFELLQLMTDHRTQAHETFLRFSSRAERLAAEHLAVLAQAGASSALVPLPPSAGEKVSARVPRGEDALPDSSDQTRPSSPWWGGPVKWAEESKASDAQSSPLANPPHSGGGAKLKLKEPASPRLTPPRSLTRDECMTFAIGKIGDILGQMFAEVDDHPTRVRLPDEPLMLVDRILTIEGEPLSMTSGRVVTEHDIHPGAWYLDCGRIPTCIAVESGQADLFLSGWLGIDFETKGLASYRLLDAVVTFHDALPQAGKTINYDIRVLHFFRQGQTYLFRFEFDATVDGRPLLTMREGCAGFFTEAELAGGKGIIHTALDKRPRPGKRPVDWSDPVPMAVESYDDSQLLALRRGDLAACFGPAFGGLPLREPVTIPGVVDASRIDMDARRIHHETHSGRSRMWLIDRVLKLDPVGGKFGMGTILGELDIHPNDWFLTCHFCDDQVMPGTLMYECCMHTLRIFLLRMGWVAEAGQIVYEPITEVRSRLKCRGQVLSSTKKVWYEVTLKEVGYGPDAFCLADALMYADGKPIVEITDMSVRLTGLSREKVERLWVPSVRRGSPDPAETLDRRSPLLVGSAIEDGDLRSVTRRGQETRAERSSSLPLNPSYDLRPAIFNTDRITAFAIGKPSEAFGDRYRVFDDERKIARLPGPPFQFLDRVVSIEHCQPWKLEAGGEIIAQYDIPVDAWYFAANRQPTMPFAVLLETALQPCGWLAGYLGSALTSETDLSFRNLGGKAIQYREVTPTSGTLTTKVKITKVSQSGGMIIQNFDYHLSCNGEPVYVGDTYFGFFSKASLANQVGIRDAKVFVPSEEESTRSSRFECPDAAPFANAEFQMVDNAELLLDGGPHGLGFVRGTMGVDPSAWFFKAHFYQDPVVPGSLGLESFFQLMKFYAVARWRLGADARFQTPSQRLDAKTSKPVPHEWVYRGQVIPRDELVTVTAVVTSVDDSARQLTAEGFLSVDGRVIYQMKSFTLAVT